MCSGIVSVSDFSNQEIRWIAAAHHAIKNDDDTAYQLYTTSPGGDKLSETDQIKLKNAVAKMLASSDYSQGISDRTESAYLENKVRHLESLDILDLLDDKPTLTTTCKYKGKYHAIWLVLTFYQQLQYPEWSAFVQPYSIAHSRFSPAVCALRSEYFGGPGVESNFSDDNLKNWMCEAMKLAGLEAHADYDNPKSMAAAASKALDIPLTKLAEKVIQQVNMQYWNDSAKKDWTHDLLGEAALEALATTRLTLASESASTHGTTASTPGTSLVIATTTPVASAGAGAGAGAGGPSGI